MAQTGQSPPVSSDENTLLTFDVHQWIDDVKRFAEDREITEYLMLKQLKTYLEANKEDIDVEFFEEMMEENPWYTKKEPIWKDPKAQDADLTGLVAVHQMQVAAYEKKKRLAVELKDFMLRQLPKAYFRAAVGFKSPQEILFSVHNTLRKQAPAMTSTLDHEYAKLRQRKSVLSATQFCQEMLTLYQKGKQYNAPFVHYALQWVVEDLVHYWPTFPRQYQDNTESSVDVIIEDFLAKYPNWLACQSAKFNFGMVGAVAPSIEKPSKSKGRDNKNEKKFKDAQSDPKPKTNCVCGSPHKWDDCYYLIKEKRPTGWIPRPKQVETIRMALENNERFRRAIERQIRRQIPAEFFFTTPTAGQTMPQLNAVIGYQPQQQLPYYPQPQALPASSAPQQPQLQFGSPVTEQQTQPMEDGYITPTVNAIDVSPLNQPPLPSNGTTTFAPCGEANETHPENAIQHPGIDLSGCDVSSPAISANAVQALQYRHWWILDTGSPLHICHSREQLENYTLLSNPFHVTFGTQGRAVAEGVGSIRLPVTTSDGIQRTVMIHKVYYVPNFIVNIISAREMQMTYGLYYSAFLRGLHDNTGSIQIYTFSAYGQVFISKGTQPHVAIAANSASPINSKQAPEKTWHERLGHAGKDVIAQLPAHTDAVVSPHVHTEGHNADAAECKACIESKSTAQISRRPIQRGESPFQVIHFDYIHMNRSYNGMRYLLHLYDTFSRAHQAFAMSTRDAKTIQLLITGFVRWTKLNGFKCVKVHTDQDPNIAGLKDDLMAMGVQLTTSTPYNHNQNGLAERAGRSLVVVMRSLRIHAGLPEQLWPWLAETAAYIMNRTPVRANAWRVPFELMTGRIPSLANLRIIGCKAHVLRKNIPHTDKLGERTWIGYLVSFHSSNIWSIWNPASNKVFRCRDVTFDEASLYKDTKHEMGQLQREAQSVAQAIREHEMTPRQVAEPHAMSTTAPPQILLRGRCQTQPQTQTQLSTDLQQTAKSHNLQLPTPDPEPVDVVTGCTMRQFFVYNHGQELVEDAFCGVVTSFMVHDGRVNLERLVYGDYTINATIQTTKTNQLHITTAPAPPKSWKTMRKHPLTDDWLAACERELNSINTRKTWSQASTNDAEGHDILPTKWVWTYKTDADGFVQNFKARLVVRGDLQTTHISKAELYAHTAAVSHFRVVVAIAADNKWDIRHLDALNAFLQSVLAEDEIFFVHPPPGFPTPSGVLYRLRRPLYGLRKSPRFWYDTCTKSLKALKLSQVKEEPGLWRYKTSFVLFYVDDFLVTGPTAELDEIVPLLQSAIDIRILGEATYFLGIEIHPSDDGSLTLGQSLYVEKMAAKYGVKLRSRRPEIPIRIPQAKLAKNENTSTPQMRLQMQQITGALLYLSVQTRPDIAKAVNMCSENASNPTKIHIQAAHEIIEYALATKHYTLRYGTMGETLTAAGDAAFGDDMPSRRSSYGYVVYLYGGPVFWTSKKQDTVANSTVEAELTALAITTREVIALKRLLGQLDIKVDEVTIHCDNKTTVDIVNGRTNVVSTKLRHLDIRQHWLRELVIGEPHSPLLSGTTLKIEWIPTAEMPADGMTKLLDKQKHKKFVEHLKLDIAHGEDAPRDAGEKDVAEESVEESAEKSAG